LEAEEEILFFLFFLGKTSIVCIRLYYNFCKC